MVITDNFNLAAMTKTMRYVSVRIEKHRKEGIAETAQDLKYCKVEMFRELYTCNLIVQYLTTHFEISFKKKLVTLF